MAENINIHNTKNLKSDLAKDIKIGDGVNFF
jgi:hypothetical protein